MKGIFFVFVFLHFFWLHSQVGGESVYAFLNLSTSPRQLAMGGADLTTEDDVNTPLWNPSVLNASMDKRLAVNYTNHLAGIALGSFAYAAKINDRLGTIHTGLTYLDYGSLVRADEQGQINGLFHAFDLALSVGLAKTIKNSPFKFGINLKCINSVIDTYSSFGLATDWAFLYRSSSGPARATLVVRNLGFQLKTFDGTREKLPLQIAFGYASELTHLPLKWHVTLNHLERWSLAVSNPSNASVDIEGNRIIEDPSMVDNAIRHLVFGAELFPKKKLNIRLGYNFRRAKELSINETRTFAGLSYGFGLRLSKLHFNYALTKFHPVSNSHTFGLIVDLNSL